MEGFLWASVEYGGQSIAYYRFSRGVDWYCDCLFVGYFFAEPRFGNLYCKYDTLFIDKMQFFFRLTCLFVFIFLQIHNKKTST